MTARHVGRGAVAGSGLAALVLAAAAAGTAKAQELDGQLLALCDEACDIQAYTNRIEEEHDAQGLPVPYECGRSRRLRKQHGGRI